MYVCTLGVQLVLQFAAKELRRVCCCEEFVLTRVKAVCRFLWIFLLFSFRLGFCHCVVGLIHSRFCVPQSRHAIARASFFLILKVLYRKELLLLDGTPCYRYSIELLYRNRILNYCIEKRNGPMF